jgi:hypothetical protein
MFQKYTGDVSDSLLSEEERERRIAQEREARERWHRDLEEGKRAREARRRARQAAEGGVVPGADRDSAAGVAPAAEPQSSGPASRREREPGDDERKTTSPNEGALPGASTDSARRAWQAGQTIYQLTLPLVISTREQLESAAAPGSIADHSAVLNAVEAQGWHLEHASFVSLPAAPENTNTAEPGAVRRAIPGDVVAIYTFRRVSRA